MRQARFVLLLVVGCVVAGGASWMISTPKEIMSASEAEQARGDALERLRNGRTVIDLGPGGRAWLEDCAGWKPIDVAYYEATYVVPSGPEFSGWRAIRPASFDEFEIACAEATRCGTTDEVCRIARLGAGKWSRTWRLSQSESVRVNESMIERALCSVALSRMRRVAELLEAKQWSSARMLLHGADQ